jgi:hypothetical protein
MPSLPLHFSVTHLAALGTISALGLGLCSSTAFAEKYNPYANANSVLVTVDEAGGEPKAPKFVYGCYTSPGSRGKAMVMGMVVSKTTANVFRRTPTTAWVKVSFGDSLPVALIATISSARDLAAPAGWGWSDTQKEDYLLLDLPFFVANSTRLLNAGSITIDWETPDPDKKKPVAQRAVYKTSAAISNAKPALKQQCSIE